MKQTIELNVDDIKCLIAKNFGVNEKQVDFQFYKVYQGYGFGESKEYEFRVVINDFGTKDVE